MAKTNQWVRLARVSATKSGETMVIGGVEVGGEGRDGRKSYIIALHKDGYLGCGCPSWIFQGWRKKGLPCPKGCKHIRAYLATKAGIEVKNGGLIRKDFTLMGDE